MGEEFARKEIEHNGKRWLVTIENYWVIEGKPVELVWNLWKPTAYGGWKKADAERAPKAACWAATCFHAGFEAGMERKAAQ